MAIPQGTSATRQTSGQLALRPPELSVPPRRREWLLRQQQNEKALRGGGHRERRRCVALSTASGRPAVHPPQFELPFRSFRVTPLEIELAAPPPRRQW